jgi:two-component system nitrogen regulation response regulator NtrX
MALDLLIVDDEADIRRLISEILRDEGYSCREAEGSESALKAIEERRPNLVILDIWLEGSPIDGIAVLARVKRDHPDIPVIMISGHGDIETAVTAIKLGAYDYIEKPFKADRLLLTAERGIDAARLKQENQRFRQRFGEEAELIGMSTPLNQLRNALERVAPTESRVLITGPAGSGKEVVARILHRGSRRAGGPFIVVNCATMAPERMETELFGTEPPPINEDGERVVGTFEQASGGTLLLDEVADMPLETQGKIVRVLQEQSFQRVNGSRNIQVDVRVIATSNRDLAAAISDGSFREDLFYRLNVVPIGVPPLMTRREDIPILIRHFMARCATEAGLPPREIGEDAIAALQAYEWPGNVRQLRNVIEWILIMAPGAPSDVVRADMLPPEFCEGTPATLRWDEGGEVMALPLRDAREIFERQYLKAQINRFGGNISKTAAFVGMERSALHRKLKLLGINAIERIESVAG